MTLGAGMPTWSPTEPRPAVVVRVSTRPDGTIGTYPVRLCSTRAEAEGHARFLQAEAKRLGLGEATTYLVEEPEGGSDGV